MSSSSSAIKLCAENLAEIAAAKHDADGAVLVPTYARSALAPGIVHFGVGNFHRSHMCVYLDELFRMGRCLDWAIVGASMMPQDAEMRNKLAAQDYLSTIVEQSAERDCVRVVGTMLDHLPVGDGQAIIEQLSSPNIRIVSLTITEGGYFIDAATGAFASDHPAIQQDANQPKMPKTVFGLITAALRNRRAKGIAVLSCDNIVQNGRMARNGVVGMARLWADDALAEWIAANVAFPNGMVDRITPATGEAEIRKCRERFGILDAHPVFCEQFKQWVIEDHFSMGRPELELVGVEFVSDVLPFEQMKLRILNGGHALIAYPAGLLGIEIGHVAMQHPLINGFLRKVEETEIIATLKSSVPGKNLHAYFSTCAERFANPKIFDTIRRLCYEGSNRQPKFIVPSIEDALRKGMPVQGLALACALWCRYCYGEAENGAEIVPNDPIWAKLKAKAAEAKMKPSIWLSEQKEIYGTMVSESPAFHASFAAALNALWQEGVECVLEKYIDDGTLPETP